MLVGWGERASSLMLAQSLLTLVFLSLTHTLSLFNTYTNKSLQHSYPGLLVVIVLLRNTRFCPSLAKKKKNRRNGDVRMTWSDFPMPPGFGRVRVCVCVCVCVCLLSLSFSLAPALWVVQGWRFSCVCPPCVWGYGLWGTFRFFQKGWFTPPALRQLARPPFSTRCDGPPQHGVSEMLLEHSARWCSQKRKVPLLSYIIYIWFSILHLSKANAIKYHV